MGTQAPASACADPALLGGPGCPAAGRRALDSALDGLLEACLREPSGAPPRAWAQQKSQLSVFDEEEVLKPDPQAHPEAVGITIMVVTGQEVLSRVARMSEPRALKAVQQACHMYTLTSDADDACPICLERLQEGQEAWRMPCWHQVHALCAGQFFRVRHAKPLCPLCRRDPRSFAGQPEGR